MQKGNATSGYLVDDFNLVQRYAARGEHAQARDLLIIHLDKKHKKYHDLLLVLVKINDARLGTVTEQEKLEIQRESLDWLLEAQRVRPNAFTRYRIGKYQLQLGDEEAALESFRAALEKAPADAHYLGAAKTLIKKLEGT
jgi:tetratricopeptide (TPR) repeat protein